MEISVPDPASAPTGVGIVGMVVVGLAAAWMYANLIWAVPHIRRALLRVPEEHRKIPHRWLGLLGVPIISGASAFLVGVGLPFSIHAALDAQGDAEGVDCGWGEGYFWLYFVVFMNLWFMELATGGSDLGIDGPWWIVRVVNLIVVAWVTRKFVRKISRASERIVAK